MSGNQERKQTASTAHLLGWATAAVGVSVLVGWAFDVPGLKTVIPGTVSMKVNSALGFVLAGLSLAVVPAGPRTRVLIRVLAGGTALLGLATLAEYLLAVDLGIDQLLFREPAGAVGTWGGAGRRPGAAHTTRMARTRSNRSVAPTMA